MKIVNSCRDSGGICNVVNKDKEISPPPQQQEKQPGEQSELNPSPEDTLPMYKASGKLEGKIAIITGGDSGIGRAVAYLFAKEGAKLTISYLEEHKDAEETKRNVEKYGGECILIPGDVGEEGVCKKIVNTTLDKYRRIDVLINNAAEQHVLEDFTEITREQLERTFKTNIFSYFYLAREAIKHMRKGACIINTSSVTAYKGNKKLIDYSSTKGAITAFTRSLALAMADKGIRVNGVAPGPIWTPLIPASFEPSHVAEFGKDTPMGRMGHPSEVAPCYVFLASEDSTYITGQILHPNGGSIVNA